MKKVELVLRRMKNTAGEEVTVGALSIYEISSSETDEMHGVADPSRRRNTTDVRKAGPYLYANPSLDRILPAIMDIWKNACKTDADIVFKLEQGVGKRTPTNPIVVH